VPVLNVLSIGSDELLRSLGKKSDDRDVESYVHKEIIDGTKCALTFLRPRKHPERLRPLLAALDISDVLIIEVQRLDAALGEALVAVGTAGISRGVAIVDPTKGEWVDADQVRTILNQAGLTEIELLVGESDPHALRELCWRHMAELETIRKQRAAAPLVIPVDQHFNVKGVGLVIIGTVQSGRVNKHDQLASTPTGETGVVRSIQVMDDDVESADAGDRVGLAMRNMGEEALTRGSLLVMSSGGIEADLIKHSKSTAKLVKAPFQNRDVEVDMVIHASIDLQFVVGRIATIENDIMTIDWQNDLFVRSNSDRPVLFCQLDAGSMRILGHAIELEPIS
jgi:selenocysteine-specific translation elongation factor